MRLQERAAPSHRPPQRNVQCFSRRTRCAATGLVSRVVSYHGRRSPTMNLLRV